VGPRTVLEDLERRKILPLPRLELRHLGRRVRSQSLYRLRYPGLHIRKDIIKMDLKVTDLEHVDWINLALYEDKLGALLNKIKKYRFP
jgi:hypothetical protein